MEYNTRSKYETKINKIKRCLRQLFRCYKSCVAMKELFHIKIPFYLTYFLIDV